MSTALLKAAPPGAASRSPAPLTLGRLLREYRGRILVTYALFNVENIVRLILPRVRGQAIDGLIGGSLVALLPFILGSLGYLVLATARRLYDTRAFRGIYTDLASQLVVQQRGQDVAVSRVAARSSLSRAFVDFVERHVPDGMWAVYSLAGAIVMLAFSDGELALYCLGLLVPACVINWLYGRMASYCNAGLHDELEKEVEVITRCEPREVRGHYGRVGGWLIRLGNWEALNFSLMELFVLVVMGAALVRVCSAPGVTAGKIQEVLFYVLMFIRGLDRAPMLVQQLSRLRDIGRRLQHDYQPGEAKTTAG